MPAIEFLGLTYNLDMLNENVQNGNRLPRVLLFRQVRWSDGHVGQEAHLEATFQAGIAKIGISDALYYCQEFARDDHGNKWTAVQLQWYPDDADGPHTPHIADIIEFDPYGNRITAQDRRQKEVMMQRAFSKKRVTDRNVVFAVQVSGHMVPGLTDDFIATIHQSISDRCIAGDKIIVFDSGISVIDATVSLENFKSTVKSHGGGSSLKPVIDWMKDNDFRSALFYSTLQFNETADILKNEGSFNLALYETLPELGVANANIKKYFHSFGVLNG